MSFKDHRCNCGKRKGLFYAKPMYPSFCGKCGGWF